MKRMVSNYSRTFLSYLFVLVFTLTITVLTYAFIIRAIEDNIIQLKMTSLERREAAISALLSEIDNYTYQYSRNSRVDEMIQADTKGSMKVGMFLNNSRSLPHYASFNSATRNYVLNSLTFFKNSGTIITDASTYLSVHWTRDYLIHGYTVGEWTSILDETRDEKIFTMETKSTTVDTSFIYRTNLPYGSDGSTNTVLLLCLNKKKLENLLLSDYGDSHAAAYVLDQEGQIILSNGLEENTRLPVLTGQARHFAYADQGMDMTVFHIKSIYNDWTYVWVLSSNQVYSERNYIVYIIGIILLIVVLLGVGIIITLARKQSKPVNEIVRMLLPQSPDKSQDLQRYGEFNWIKGNIQELMSHEKRLQKQLMNNKDLVRSAMLEKLLEGRFADEQAAEQALRQIQFSFSLAGYTVIALQIAENEKKVSAVANTQVQHSVLLNFIAGRYPEITAHSVNYQQIVLLYPINTTDTQQAQSFAAQLSDFVNEKGHTNILIGVGSVCSDLSSIHRSYRSACFALAKAKAGYGGVVFDMSGDDHNNSLYYPLEIEQRIISLVSMGDDDEIHVVLESVYKQNMTNLGQQDDLIMIFLSELVGTLIKAMDVAGLENSPEFEAIPKLLQNPRMSPDETFQSILASYHDLCLQIKHNHRDSTSVLIKNVTEYIESFYMDSSLSLCKLANKFNLSEPYLSHVFKERTGENLSSCLERIRINYAHALLTETTMSIDDIAEKVGYNSSDTFRKAFKRFHGITPAMYRSSTKSA